MPQHPSPTPPGTPAANGREASRHNYGRYRLYDAIAAGGMATVHYGRLHGELGFARTVAIKRLHREYVRDPEFVAMFMDEARLTMRVQHPNVVQTLDVVAADGEILLVMEYVAAVSLWQLLRLAKKRGENVSPSLAAAVAADALRGLHAAHEATDEAGNPLDIVHRDVSPQNVLVGADGSARVLDFGVAKASGRQQTTREGQVKGKFAYMAPEQITNVCVTRQSDVFAASIVLWEALTGVRLFQAESEPALLARVLSAPIPAPSTVARGIDPELDCIVLRGLARDLAVRYPSAREMARDLEAHAALASASQVAEWVEHLASDELAERAARVAAIENESRSERVSVTTVLAGGTENAGASPDDDGDRQSRAQRRGWRTIAAGALGLAAIVAALGATRMQRLRAHDHSTPAPAAAAPPSAAALAGATAAPPDPGIQGPAAVTAHAEPTTTATATPLPGAPGAKPARPAAPRSSSAAGGAQCDPPYYVDSGGHLIYKAACFR